MISSVERSKINLPIKVIQRKKAIFIKEFCKHFTDYLEEVDRKVGGKIEIGRKCKYATSAVGWFGKGISSVPVAGPFIALAADAANSAIKRGSKKSREIKAKAVKYKIDEADVAGIVENAVEIIIEETAYEVANIYEYQIAMLSCSDGYKYILRMAEAAVDRMISYIIKPEVGALDRNTLLRGLFEGEPRYKSYGSNKLTTIFDSDENFKENFKEKYKKYNQSWEEWNVFSVFNLPGIRVETEGGFKFYPGNTGDNSKPEKYGYRNITFELAANSDGQHYYKQEEIKLSKINTIDFAQEYRPLTWIVGYPELEAYANSLQQTKKPKSFNKFIKTKYGLGKDITAIFRCRHKKEIESIKTLKLQGGNFAHTDFMHADLSGMDLQGIDFSQSFLTGANFAGSDVRGACFYEAKMVLANICGTNFADTATDLTKVDIRCVVADQKTNLENVMLTDEMCTMGAIGLILAKRGFPIFAEYRDRIDILENRRENDKKELEYLKVELRKLKVREQIENLELICNNYGKEQLPKTYYVGQTVKQLAKIAKDNNILLLTGVPGSGKTQLAIHYAKCFEPNNPNCVIWRFQGITGKDKVTDNLIRDSYYALAYKLKIKTKSEKLEDIKAEVTKKLIARKGARFLFIFDDINHYEQIAKYLPDAKVLSGRGKIVTTSRNSNFSINLQPAKQLQLKGLELEEAVEFLLEGQDLTKLEIGTAKTIAKNFSCLPLGLAAAKMYMQKHNISAQKYLEYLTTSSSLLKKREIELLKPYYKKEEEVYHLIDALKLQVNTLKDKAGDLLKYIAFLANNNIPIFLLKNYIQEELELNEIINQIKETSLIWSSGGKDDSRMFSIHGITQEIIRLNVSLDKQKIIIKQLLKNLTNCFSRGNQTPRMRQQNSVLMPHVALLFEQLNNPEFRKDKQFIQETRAQRYCLKIRRGVYYDFHDQSQAARNILKSYKKKLEDLIKVEPEFNQIEKFCNALAEVDTRLPTLYAQTLYQLGRTYFRIGGSVAEYKDYLSSAVKVRDAIDQNPQWNDCYNEGKPRPIDSVIMLRSGYLQFLSLQAEQEQDATAAIKLLEKAAKGYIKLIENEEQLVEDKKDIFNFKTCCRELSTVYKRLAVLDGPTNHDNHLEQALKTVCKSIGVKSTELAEILKALKGREVSDTKIAKDYNNIANIFLERKDTKNAEFLFLRAKEIEESKDIKQFPLADTYFGLAKIYFELEQLDKAVGYIDKCIEIRSKIKHYGLQEAMNLQKAINVANNQHAPASTAPHSTHFSEALSPTVEQEEQKHPTLSTGQ